ncbi:MAG TPA: chemotaxis protein CheA [Bryobacteraceae bacterium]|nr:chemotaxis protein CheA [Bryobacteraceae bacterium]
MQFNPIATFLQEAEELLGEIEQSALLVSSGGSSEEIIHELFRAFHTIKGSGAMCGLEGVAGFTHHVESLLDKVRGGTFPVSPALAELLLKAKDQIRLLLAAETGGAAVPPGSSEALIAAVAAFGSPEREDAEQTWRIEFRPNPSLFINGGNPTALLRQLRKLGPCRVVADTGEVPELNELQPDRCYLSWTIHLTTASDRNAIRDVFIFVEDDSHLAIEVAQAVAGKTESAEPAANSPERVLKLVKEATVRVPSQRLDRLVNLVGELVMNQSRLAQAAFRNNNPELANPLQELERLVAELRDDVLGIRMLPIGTLFGRFRRLIHDLSKGLGKEVDLVAEGDETELDKSILDQLGEPLIHCLRNAVDHAAETPEERLASGKPRRATIRLSAEHTGSDVVVRIQDDGRGIDRAAVRQRAIEKQLIAPSTNLSDKEIFNLVLLPGFSTARQVTSVSGRGVGMDAVKRQIDALHGSLTLASEAGKGTCVSITLPLTLAIIEGLLVEIGSDRFIVPMAAVTENVELLASQRERNNGRNVIAVRGELIPYIDLRAAFAIDLPAPVIEKVVIVRHEDQRVGMVVDRVLGTHQTVIQSLGRFLRTIEVVSGATILGDGRVALILDVPAVVRFAEHRTRSANSGIPIMAGAA